MRIPLTVIVSELARAAAIALVVMLAGGAAFVIFDTPRARAATQSVNIATEIEIGRQKIQPGGVATQLTIPLGTQHAEFYLEGADALIRWDGEPPVDSATGAMKWPAGHMRKEANDTRRIEGFRILCTGCTLWVDYSRRWRSGDPS